MEIIITYDLSGGQGPVKADMIDNKGYKDHFYRLDEDDKLKKVYLPETTLYHKSKTPRTAVDDLLSSCEEQEVEVVRCVADIISDSQAGIWGKPIR